MSEPVRHYRESMAQPPVDAIADPEAFLVELLKLPLTGIECVDHGLDLLLEVARFKRFVEAKETEVRARLRELASSMPDQVISAEVALATRTSSRDAARVLHEADDLAHGLAPLLAGLRAGRISLQHVRRASEVLRPLLREDLCTCDGRTGPEVAAELAEQILPYAEHHTPGETASRLRSCLITADPRSADERHREALAKTNVTHDVLEDGVGLLSITGPVEQTSRAYYAIDSTARSEAAGAPAGDERRIGERRCTLALGVLLDAATPLDLPEGLEITDEIATTLLEASPSPEYSPGVSRDDARCMYVGPYWRQLDQFGLDRIEEGDYDPEHDPEPPDPWPDVEVCPPRRRRGQPVTGKLCRTGTAPYLGVITTDLPTLLGTADNPMLLDGVIPITAERGRRLFNQADFTRLLLEPGSGELLDASPHVYRPSRALAAFVDLRDGVCGEPGCVRAAATCEIDHERSFNHADPASGGQTVRDELGNLCKPGHDRKTSMGFWIERDLEGRRWWVTPSGRRYPMERFDHRPTKGYSNGET